MAELNVQQVSLAGISPVYVAADVAGDSFLNYGKTVFHVKNDSASVVTVTVASNPCQYGANHDVNVTVAAGEEKQIGSFQTARFNDDNYKVNVSYDAVTSVTVAAIKY